MNYPAASYGVSDLMWQPSHPSPPSRG